MFHARTLNIIKDGENQISMASFLFDHADNSIIDNAQALRGMRAQFQKEFETYREITPSFSRLACQLMERQHWNSSIFKEKTLLDEARAMCLVVWYYTAR